MENTNEKIDETIGEFRATRSERVMPLHNFALPSLKWGNQRFLRCMKVDSSTSDDDSRLRRQVSPPVKYTVTPSRMMTSGHHQPPPTIQHQHHYHQYRAATPGSADHEVRQKVTSDLREVEEEMKKTSLREAGLETEIEGMEKARRRDKHKVMETEEQTTPARSPPWNLRTRKGTAGNGNGSSSRRWNDHQKPLGSMGEDKAERPKFSVTLTKKEIEEDFLAMTGNLPPRRPKKRPGNVQRQIDSIFPGSWLTEVTPDAYKVQESNERKKT